MFQASVNCKVNAQQINFNYILRFTIKKKELFKVGTDCPYVQFLTPKKSL